MLSAQCRESVRRHTVENHGASITADAALQVEISGSQADKFSKFLWIWFAVRVTPSSAIESSSVVEEFRVACPDADVGSWRVIIQQAFENHVFAVLTPRIEFPALCSRCAALYRRQEFHSGTPPASPRSRLIVLRSMVTHRGGIRPDYHKRGCSTKCSRVYRIRIRIPRRFGSPISDAAHGDSRLGRPP